jgi:succinyl-CoA synthetase beta subunit
VNLHEYQAKEVLQTYGIPIPEFGVVHRALDVEKILSRFHFKEAVIKIQVHAGGRGKAGGVQFGKSAEEILSWTEKLLGMRLVNEQTGPDGVIAHKVLISRPIDIKKEYYLACTIDRERALPILIASPEGGMDIEEIAEKFPQKIAKLPIELDGRLRSFRQMQLCNLMDWKGARAKMGSRIAVALARAFIATDASLLEINPLVEDQNGDLWALDAKLSIDDNALYRQSELAALFDPTQQNSNEVKAREFDLAYIALDGEIGCMVNGAGLAMATMDIIKFYGGRPANFLDVGGGASAEKVTAGFKILVGDARAKAILINIFGGIMSCKTIAEGILAGAAEMKKHIPMVVRLEGTHVEEGTRLFQKSSFPIITAKSLADAAEKVVAQVR